MKRIIVLILLLNVFTFNAQSIKKEKDSITQKRFAKAISIDLMQYYTTFGIGIIGRYRLRNNFYLDAGISSGLGKVHTPHPIVNNVSIGVSQKVSRLIFSFKLGCSFSFVRFDRTYGYSNAKEAFIGLGQLPLESFEDDVPFPWYPKKIIDFGLNFIVGYDFNKFTINLTGSLIKSPFPLSLIYSPNLRVFRFIPGARLDFKF
jgi:hypothetical protein